MKHLGSPVVDAFECLRTDICPYFFVFVFVLFGIDLRSAQRKTALDAAIKAQSVLARSAAGGMGVDRHLLKLSGLAREDGSADALALFDDPLYARSSTWKISTSNVASPWLSHFGFGPVCDDGYGFGYQIQDDGVPLHVTSWNHSQETVTSQEMYEGVSNALEELRSVCTEY